MGPILPKPVTSKVIERKGNKLFRVGLSSMNGFREKQEDAHAMLLLDGKGGKDPTGGFFGVFDGHCGPLCSKYIADRFQEELARKHDQQTGTLKLSDEQLTDLCLQLDREFLGTSQEGGSTGTFTMVYYDASSQKYSLQVGNVGDSRVVLGRREQREVVSMTEDHKPNNELEAKRIAEAGGHVSNNRVDGSLAVSRAFGDASYKSSDKERTHKVIAVPEFKTVDAKKGDLILLCCDGVFESDAFDNEGVMNFIFERVLDQKMDLAKAAAEVCKAALVRGSKDNISAMIVRLGDEGEIGEHEEFWPGPWVGPEAGQNGKFHQKFHDAYIAACEQALGTNPQKEDYAFTKAADLRWEQVNAEIARRAKETGCVDGARTCNFDKLELQDLKSLHARVTKQQEGPELPKAAYIEELSKNEYKDEDRRPVDVQDLLAELEAMALPAALKSRQPGDPARLEHWGKRLRDLKEEAGESGGQDAVTAKIIELQRAGLPLPVILGLLARGGGQMPGGPKP